MVTPSGIFSSSPPSVPRKAKETRLEQEASRTAGLSEQDVKVAVVHTKVTMLPDQTSLETERPEPPQRGIYMVGVTMTAAGQVQRRVVPVKARAYDSEASVQQRVHSAFVRSVCEAKHVAPPPPHGEDQGFSLRRAGSDATHLGTGEVLRTHGAAPPSHGATSSSRPIPAPIVPLPCRKDGSSPGAGRTSVLQ